MTLESEQKAPDYGIDAPGAVRNLFVVGGLGFLIWATAAAGLWSGVVAIPLGNSQVVFPFRRIGLASAIVCTFMGVWMVWDSKVGKIRTREQLLDQIPWTGSERVLDVGCGRGLMLIGAAKRLTTGKATGIDIWRAEDLSGNTKDATLENARREGVGERVDVLTTDMRQMPFPDATFDVAVSMSAIHNLYDAKDRAKAIAEIARVLKPGGYAIIDDIRHGPRYAADFKANGCKEIRSALSGFGSLVLTIMSCGAVRPMTLIVKK